MKAFWVFAGRGRLATPARCLALLLVPLIPAASTTLSHHGGSVTSSAARRISYADAQRLEQALWIDARSEPAYEREHIPGALRLTVAEWEELLPAVLSRLILETTLVVYCGGGSCALSAGLAGKIIRELELPRVFVLSDHPPPN